MTPITARPTCPSCGGPLAAVALGGDTPPWLCEPCSRAWWWAELANADKYNARRRDFGGSSRKVADLAEEERAAALARGTGATFTTLAFLPDDVVAELATRDTLAQQFVGQVRAERAERKAGR